MIRRLAGRLFAGFLAAAAAADVDLATDGLGGY